MAKAGVILLLSLIFSFNLNAQNPASVAANYELEPIKIEAAEDFGYINDAIEDKEGYLWMSSSKGLGAFDGRNLVLYHVGKSKPAGAYGNLQKLLQGPHNEIYAENATAGNLLSFDAFKRKESAPIDAHHPNKIASFLSISPNNKMCVLMLNEHKTTFSIEKRTAANTFRETYSENEEINLPCYFNFVQGSNWLIKGEKITRFSEDGEKIKDYTVENATGFQSVYFNDATFYLMDLEGRNIYAYDAARDQVTLFFHLPFPLQNRAFKLLVSGNRMFIGNDINLYVCDIKTKTLHDISSQYIHDIKENEPNGIGLSLTKLLSMRNGDILLVRQKSIYKLKEKMPLSAHSVTVEISGAHPNVSFRALAADEQGNIYASYYTGIAKKNRQEASFKTLPFTNKIPGRFLSTYSLNYWDNHIIWNNTLIDLRTNKFRFLGVEEYAGHTAQCLHGDTLWFILWFTDKLFMSDLRHGTTSMFLLDKTLGNNGLVEDVNDLVFDAKSNSLWVAIKDNGICNISTNGKVLKKYSTKELGLKNWEYGIVNDLELKDGKLWYASTEGLGCLDITHASSRNYPLTSVSKAENIQNRVIFSILPDTAANFFLGTDQGLYYFDTKHKTYSGLEEDEQLAKIEFNRGSAFRSPQGTCYFGGTDGLYSFSPASLRFKTTAKIITPVKIYSTTIYNNRDGKTRRLDSAVNNMDQVYLRPQDENISFYFSSPDLSGTRYYSYVIHGQSEKWTNFSKDNRINIYKLEPGEYTLEIKAWNGLNADYTDVTSVKLIMPQIWYKKFEVRCIFIALIILGTTLAVRQIYLFRLQRQHDLARLRTKISADLHDDVGTILAGISMQSQLLTYTANKELGAPINEIGAMSVDAMDRMRDIVWALDSRKDKYEDLIERMRVYTEHILPVKFISYKLEAKLDKKTFINPEKRQSIYLIFKEALTNIVKHSNCNSVLIQLKAERGKIILIIHDNGTSQTVTDNTGTGIANMKMRAEKIGAELKTFYDEGFVVQLSVPNRN